MGLCGRRIFLLLMAQPQPAGVVQNESNRERMYSPKLRFFSVNTENTFANPVRFLFCVKSTSTFLFLPLVSTGAQREEFESRAGFQLFAYGSG